MTSELTEKPVSISQGKCDILFCHGPEDCVALSMINQATDITDLNNTFEIIASNCALANEPELIKAYQHKLGELNSSNPQG